MPIIDITPMNNNVNFEKFKRYFTITTETKDCFDYISGHSKPYLVTLQECINVGIYGPNTQRYGTEKLLEHVIALIKGIDGNSIDMQNFSEQTADNEQNMLYHCCKIMYLIEQYNTVGLHSTMQALTEGNHMFVHPGCSRIHAHSYLQAYDEKIIVWDRHNKFSEANSGWPRSPLSFEEWHEIFKKADKDIFAVNDNGQILEMHMQEERKDIVGSVQSIRAMFNFQKPILIGDCEDDVFEYIRPNYYSPDDTSESKGVIIDSGNYKFKKEDLIHLLALYPYSSEKVIKENFVIYTN